MAVNKLLGDAGEHYALSQFSFASKFAAKMPDNWKDYDLAVESGEGLSRISVKTRSETKAWAANAWFDWDSRKSCDWFVFIFKPNLGPIRSWVMPASIAEKVAKKPGSRSKSPWYRELSWKKLNSGSLDWCEDNWSMQPEPPTVEILVADIPDVSSLLIKESE
jgi:hypothetical protein